MLSSNAMLLLAVVVVAPAGAASIAPRPMVSGESAPVWDGPQFVQADRAGTVYFLRGDTLDVYAVTKSGGLSKLSRLKVPLAKGGLVLHAALSPSGDRWLVHAPPDVLLFTEGEEKVLPSSDWTPWSVGFLRDTPIVAAIPRPSPAAGRHQLTEAVRAPWMLSLAGDRWSPLTWISKGQVAQSMKKGGMNDAIAQTAVFLKGDREGKLWAARQYAYRVQRLSPAGRVLTELTVDGGEVQSKGKASQGIEIKLHGANDNPTEATRDPRTEKATAFAFSGKPVILDLTEGPDGRLYLLVRLSEGGLALDRFDRGERILERVTLEMAAPAAGTFTVAAGRAALYLAAFQARSGRWLVPWDLLEQAKWQLVEGAEVDGGVAAQPIAAGAHAAARN